MNKTKDVDNKVAVSASSSIDLLDGAVIWGELYLDSNNEAHFVCHTKDDDFQKTKMAIQKFITLLQGQLDREKECPFFKKAI